MTADSIPVAETEASVTVARRNNNFDALRITAALCVIVGHSFILTGSATGSPWLGGVAIEYIGVSIFFVISGYLITGSWERSHSVGQYVSSRALRIAPLLFLVVLVSTFVLGPLATVLSKAEYFSSPQTWRYLINMVLLPADGLPGVFSTVPYPNVVNGSVWTLRAEVICYVVVLVLGLLPRRIQLAGFVLFGALAIVLVVAGPVSIAGSNVSAAGGTWIYFAIGALVRLLLPRRLLRPLAAAVVLAVWLLVGWLVPSIALYVTWIALPYIVLSFGLASTAVLHRAARFGDISYGLYLWAFPVQQLTVQLLGPLAIPLDLLVVVPVTALLSFASWHLLEKRALAFRFRLPFFKDEKATATSG